MQILNNRTNNRRNAETKDKQRKPVRKGGYSHVPKKLAVLFFLILLAFAYLSIALFRISYNSEETYKKQVLSQLSYDSKTLPFRRGNILDANGIGLAVSEKVYNLVIDAKVIMTKESYFEPTMQALAKAFPELDMKVIRQYVQDNKDTSSYYVPLKQLTVDQKLKFTAQQTDEENEERHLIKGVWFEEEYKRVYPNGTLACDVIGFTNADNNGLYGLEEYYNETLNGTTGREYGYLNADSNLERTTKAAVDGNTIVSTIDVNIQKIIEKYLLKFNEEHKDEARKGNGANNLGCIIMEVNTGKVLGMASYPNFDLNSPYDLSAYFTEEEIAQMKEDDVYLDTCNGIWRNFCISDTFEPGSTFKPFTVAMALENGIISSNDTYTCEGVYSVGGHEIHCNNGRGHGTVTVSQAISKSCNVAMMKIAAKVGAQIFSSEQSAYNFGLKTNIDLSGEARTVGLVFDESMGSSDLATNSFGQNFNATMIQMISGFSALVNGGYYYEPHMISRIETTSGAIVENIEPKLLKQVISEETSDRIISYCNQTVTSGTGKSARPAGYAIGGKTGTAQTLPRGNGEYIVSFLGYAPADDPQIAIYVVVDRANVEEQDNSRLAQKIARNILTEVLPYLNIYMTEPLSPEEELELQQLKLENTYIPAQEDENTGGEQSGQEDQEPTEDTEEVEDEGAGLTTN